MNSASAAASTPAMLRRYGTVFIPTRGPKASTLGLLRENRPRESRFLPVGATFLSPQPFQNRGTDAESAESGDGLAGSTLIRTSEA